MARRPYYTKPVTQDEINEAARGIQAQLSGLNLTVTSNGHGYRIECDTCGWAARHGPLSTARSHAATH